MSANNLSITVAMLSYQDERILEECLASVRNQTYDQSLVSILLVDGGSTDRTLEIARKYGATVISRPELKDQPQQRGEIVMNAPTTDLIMPFSADNRLQERDALARMVETFSDESLVACSTWRYGYRRSDPILTRYFALIGGNDPIAVGLGKADRAPYDAKVWHSFGEVEDLGQFYRVKFEPDPGKVPTLGANGFAYRKDLLQKSSFTKYGTHIDVCLDLIQQGHRWLGAGARQVVIEARESAVGIGCFDEDGKFNPRVADRFAEAFGLGVCLFEAPNKPSQFAFLNHFGRDVHLCNVRLEEILRVEIYRRGLHSDAFAQANLRPDSPG